MDLKWLLVRRITLVAVACFFTGAGLALYVSAREAKQQNTVLAELASRELELQLSRIDRSTQTPDQFPDWDLLSNFALAPGQCVEFHGADPRRNRSSCSGLEANAPNPPVWFAEAYRRLINEHLSASRPLAYRGAARGVVHATFAPAATSGRAWAIVSPLLGLSALLVGALCLVTYLVVDRSLRPADDILKGLNRLAEGDLTVRLPAFQLVEFDRISHGFNDVLEELERATAERAEFAHRLVDTQEQERRHLARELHDEIAQRLAAISALAACVRNSAQAEAPHLVGEARELERMASNSMFALRRTLSYLRPQEIDDRGLVSSLKALVDQYNESAGGRTAFSIEAGDELEELRADASAHVYRIVQEALTNAAKHASARTVMVKLTGHADNNRKTVCLSVVDDGIGQLTRITAAQPGSGLIGIQERVSALSGTFVAGSLPKGGFGLHIEFPLAPKGA